MDDKRKGFFQGAGNPNRQKKHGRDYHKEPGEKPVKEIKFRDEKGNLRRELLVEEARDFAEKMDRGRVSFTQLRSFFNDVLSIKERLEKGNKSYEEVEAEIAMLISKANYRKIRDLKNTELLYFIEYWINRIHNRQNFLDFALHFEAVVGFFPRRR